MDTNSSKPTSSKKSFWFHSKWGIGWTFFVFLLCSFPGKAIPSSHWFDLISLDKLIHATIFWILTVLWMNALKNQTNFKISSFQILLVSVLFSIFYGGLMEIMQATVFADRSCDWNDFIANTIGALFASYYHQPKMGYRLGILK